MQYLEGFIWTLGMAKKRGNEWAVVPAKPAPEHQVCLSTGLASSVDLGAMELCSCCCAIPCLNGSKHPGLEELEPTETLPLAPLFSLFCRAIFFLRDRTADSLQNRCYSLSPRSSKTSLLMFCLYCGLLQRLCRHPPTVKHSSRYSIHARRAKKLV